MPVLGRIDWAMRQLSMGRIGHITVGPAQDPCKVKCRVVLHPTDAGALQPLPCRGISEILRTVRHLVVTHSSVDRGHRHTSGISEFSIWITITTAEAPAAPLPTSRPHRVAFARRTMFPALPAVAEAPVVPSPQAAAPVPEAAPSAVLTAPGLLTPTTTSQPPTPVPGADLPPVRYVGSHQPGVGLATGRRIITSGLRDNSRNTHLGSLGRFLPDRGRWEVLLDGEARKILMCASNLALFTHDQDTPTPD